MSQNRVILKNQLEKSTNPDSIIKTNASNEAEFLQITGTDKYLGTDNSGVVGLHNVSNDWKVLGNTGTNPATNFIGTTDTQPLIAKSNNTELLRLNSPSATVKTITQTGSVISTSLTLPNFTVNAVLGTASATVDQYETIIVNQTTPNISLFINNPTTIVAGRKLTIVNSGTSHFWVRGAGITLGAEVPFRSFTEFIHDGTNWVPRANGGSEFWGVLRNTGGTWAILNDATHESHNLTNPITSPVNHAVSVDNQLAAEQVGTSIVTVDETYTEYGLSAGVSQGISTSSIKIAKKGFGVYITFDGTNWVANTNGIYEIAQASDFVFSFNGATGVLTVTHTNINIIHDLFAISVTGRNGILAQLDGITQTSFQLVFRDIVTGAILTTPTTACRAYVSHNGMWEPNATKLAITVPNPAGNANLWIYGKFKN